MAVTLRSAQRPALVTAAGAQMRAVLNDLSRPTFQAYARHWDYTVIAEELGVDGVGADPAAQSAKWRKLALLRQALEQHPFALWVDADVLILRTDADIRDNLHPACFQALALEQVPHEHRVNPNTGVWLLRSCPAAFDFLDAVEQAGPQPGPWSDQGAVLAALGWDRGDEQYHWARPGPGNQFSQGTSWLPPGWNQPYQHGRDGASSFSSDPASYVDRPVVANPHALHFMGMTPAARYRHMAAVLRQATDLAQ